MTDEQKKDHIAANWRTVPKKTICKDIRIGYKTFEKFWHQLHAEARVPAVREMVKTVADHMKPVLTDEQIIRYIAENNDKKTKTAMIAELTVCARRFRTIYKECADAGLIVPRVHGGAFDPRRKAKPKRKPVTVPAPSVAVMPWVPEKFVKKSARWLAA